MGGAVDDEAGDIAEMSDSGDDDDNDE